MACNLPWLVLAWATVVITCKAQHDDGHDALDTTDGGEDAANLIGPHHVGYHMRDVSIKMSKNLFIGSLKIKALIASNDVVMWICLVH